VSNIRETKENWHAAILINANEIDSFTFAVGICRVLQIEIKKY